MIMSILHRTVWKLKDRKAQILLPAVLLAPIFILVIYLLFEMAKVSMTKVRQQFALDNAAYTQVSVLSTYLNAVAMINGPLPYRVMLYYKDMKVTPKPTAQQAGKQPVSVFELFYHGGGIPALGPDYDTGVNGPPDADSTDWGLRYDPSIQDFPRGDWEKEQPREPDSETWVPVMSRSLVDDYYFPALRYGVEVIKNYLTTFATTGNIFESQEYIYKQETKNAVAFRTGYFLNTNDCKKSDCARQSAAQLRRFLSINLEPFELNKLRFYASDSGMSGEHGGAYNIDFSASEILPNGSHLFQFAYVDANSRSRLRTLGRGIKLKQSFKLPKNYFNINLEQKYKPYVRNTVVLSCPRSNNNCVWPNPLPKYNVTLDP